jgi:hypothetical protein
MSGRFPRQPDQHEHGNRRGSYVNETGQRLETKREREKRLEGYYGFSAVCGQINYFDSRPNVTDETRMIADERGYATNEIVQEPDRLRAALKLTGARAEDGAHDFKAIAGHMMELASDQRACHKNDRAALLALREKCRFWEWNPMFKFGWDGVHEARTGHDLQRCAGVTIEAYYARVEIINLGYCNLGGNIPVALGQLKMLRKLWLNDNRLGGEIPAVLGNCKLLNMLLLQNNQLKGALPDELASCRLVELNVSGNEGLSGGIPQPVLEMSKHELRLDVARTGLIIDTFKYLVCGQCGKRREGCEADACAVCGATATRECDRSRKWEAKTCKLSAQSEAHEKQEKALLKASRGLLHAQRGGRALKKAKGRDRGGGKEEDREKKQIAEAEAAEGGGAVAVVELRQK